MRTTDGDDDDVGDDQDFGDWVDDADEGGEGGASSAVHADPDAASMRGPKTPIHALFPDDPGQSLKRSPDQQPRFSTPRRTAATSARSCAASHWTRSKSSVCSIV
ncbi:unnamed protein product [Tilletia controversa]|uniref:Uncharacterized protein n=1 Tax=Tilletia controversa TaxID=13291 RepID=A0A8X7MN94_9BASI|nr:hypothetical protein A4X06_0g7184 [Tilletia controversa]CAD6974754.1 unnamed protein product [Tilletia controversa]